MPSLSRKIFYVLVFLAVLSLLNTWRAVLGALYLTPGLVLHDVELWRVLTYPLAIGPYDILFASIAFLAPGEEVEGIMGTRAFVQALIGVILLGAAIHLAGLFASPAAVLMGPRNLAFFVLVGYVYLLPFGSVRLFIFNIPARPLVLFLLIADVAAAVYDIVNQRPLLVALNGGLVGAVAAVVYFQIRYQKYPVLLGTMEAVRRAVGRGRAPRHEPDAAKSSPRRVAATAPVRVRGAAQAPAAHAIDDEERMNMLLDKINEKGYPALSEEEKRFLSDYSGRL